AKATQEVSKTISKGIDKTSEALKFITTVFGKPIKDIAEIAGDYTEYWKINNAITLHEKLMKTVKEKNLKLENPLPLRIGIPLIDAALNEDENSLQELWANLLASSMSNTSVLGVTKTYIEVIKNLDAFDAELLNGIFMIHMNSIVAKDKSNWANVSGYNYLKTSRALLNIERLGIIKILEKENQKDDVLSIVFLDKKNKEPQFTVWLKITVFGIYFMNECTNIRLLSEDDGGEFVAVDERIKVDFDAKLTVKE
ncbi:MAG: hypothetical protein A3J96_04520, partial [Sulfurimonas sp. RIFOXYC2_FULL_36_7]